MEINDLILDGLSRGAEIVDGVLASATPEQMAYRPDPEANPAGWLAWHVAFSEDFQVASLAGWEPVWTAGGWYERFDLPADPDPVMYGDDPRRDRIARPDAPLLREYFAAVRAQTAEYVRGLTPADLDRVLDEPYDPKPTVGVRLVSIIDHGSHHAGQIDYLMGLARTAVSAP